jgi:hypothetical protein
MKNNLAIIEDINTEFKDGNDGSNQVMEAVINRVSNGFVVNLMYEEGDIITSIFPTAKEACLYIKEHL